MAFLRGKWVIHKVIHIIHKKRHEFRGYLFGRKETYVLCKCNKKQFLTKNLYFLNIKKNIKLIENNKM